MTTKDGGGAGSAENRKRREARLAEALRANLARRKDQARARRAGEPDRREGLAQATPVSDDEALDGKGEREPDDAA